MTVGEALKHGDDIDVDSALMNFPTNKKISRKAMMNIYHFSHAQKNHLSTKKYVEKAGLNLKNRPSITDLIRKAIK